MMIEKKTAFWPRPAELAHHLVPCAQTRHLLRGAFPREPGQHKTAAQGANAALGAAQLDGNKSHARQVTASDTGGFL